jgi:hypothetical protein
MNAKQELYNKHLNRITTAISLGKPDKVPVILYNDLFAPGHMGIKMADYLKDMELVSRTMLKSLLELGEVDGVQGASQFPHVLSAMWLSKVKMPGIELGENEMWQIAEQELMKTEDYDVIIDKGWQHFYNDYLVNRLDNLPERIAPYKKFAPLANQWFADEGIVVIKNATLTIPFEMFCGGRTMVKFMRDLYTIPDKVQAAMDVAIDALIESAANQLRASKPLCAWVGGWRSASEFLNKKFWDRFVWPYFKRLADTVIQAGVVPIFHLDSNWDRDMENFKDFPSGKCVMSTDGSTDIYRVKELLGGRMCIMGDVPPALTALGTPDEVYNYCLKQINEIGPSGYMLSTGCNIPANAKADNLKAMIAAARA